MCIHGDKAQQERDWVLNEFKSGKTPIMIATDVASRGLGSKLDPAVACVHAAWRFWTNTLGLDVVTLADACV